jgi:hypothetical protein
MDILNFISWIKGKRIFTNIDTTQAVLPVGIKDPKRDDDYLTGVMTVSNFINLLPTGPQGAPGAQGPIGPQGVAGPVGPAGLNWQGSWSVLGTYVIDDAVGYGGASWFCIDPVGPSAVTPDSDPTNWALLASQGSPGPQGPQGIAGASSNAPVIIVADALDGTVVTGTTTSTISKSYLIPSNTLKTNSILEVSWGVYRTTGLSTIQTQMWINSSNTLVGATRIATGANQALQVTGYLRNIRDIQKVGDFGYSYNAFGQVSSDLGTGIGTVRTTFNLNNSLDLYIMFSIENTNAGDSSSINRVRITEY